MDGIDVQTKLMKVESLQNYNTPYCFFASKSGKSEDKDGEKEFDDDAATQDYIVKLPQLVPENPPDAKKEISEIDDILKKYLEK